MTPALKPGARVIVVEGPDKGTEGTVLESWRGFDRDSKTTGNRVKIQIGTDDNEKPITLTTRAAWVRESR